MLMDYHKQAITVGDIVRSIETGWTGKIMAVEEIGGETMLRCQCVSFWTGKVEDDDTRWFAPEDVAKRERSLTSL